MPKSNYGKKSGSKSRGSRKQNGSDTKMNKGRKQPMKKSGRKTK